MQFWGLLVSNLHGNVLREIRSGRPNQNASLKTELARPTMSGTNTKNICYERDSHLEDLLKVRNEKEETEDAKKANQIEANVGH